jgi:hypothetical protein
MQEAPEQVDLLDRVVLAVLADQPVYKVTKDHKALNHLLQDQVALVEHKVLAQAVFKVLKDQVARKDQVAL